MKRVVIWLVALAVAGLSLGLVACGGDDDEGGSSGDNASSKASLKGRRSVSG